MNRAIYRNRPLIQLFSLGFLLALALGIHQLSAWTSPTQTPPNCVGCTVPLHTGSGVQTKTGGLQASTLDIASSMSVGGVPSGGPYLIDMDAATPGATAGIRFPDGTVQTSAASGMATTVSSFTVTDTLSMGSGAVRVYRCSSINAQTSNCVGQLSTSPTCSYTEKNTGTQSSPCTPTNMYIK